MRLLLDTHVLPLLLIAVVSAAMADDATTRPVIPDAASLAAADRALHELFGKELDSPTPEVRRAAAEKLLHLPQPPSGPAEQFVTFQAARRAAASAGDAVTAFAALDQLDRAFAIDVRQVRAETAVALAKSARDPFDIERTHAEAMRAMDEDLAADDYPAAAALVSQVRPMLQSHRRPDLLAELDAKAKAVRDVGAEYPAVRPTLTKLAAKPEDPAANVAVGRFYCFRKGDWLRGLPLLARGNDAPLHDLATEESTAAGASGPDADAVALKIADGWWDVAAAQPEPVRAAIEAHAGDWYRRAASAATGLRKLQVEERINRADHARQASGLASSGDRWTVLFRGSDPQIWNHPAGDVNDRDGFAADVNATAPPDTRYLRLRRMDTAEAIIIPIKQTDLLRITPTWCGTAWTGYGGTHLAVKNPAWPKLEKGFIDVDGNYLGWGFGHIMYVPDEEAKGYSWAGKKIDKTVFEIAVSASDLTATEQPSLLPLK